MGYRILFRWTHQSLSIGCLVVHLKLGQLVIDVVDHRAQTVSTHGKKFCCPSMMDVAVAVHHAQLYHGRFDRRDIGVAVLRTTNDYSSLETDPVSTVFFIGFPDASCLLHVLLLLDGAVYPVQTTLHFFSKGEEVSPTPNLYFCSFCVGHSILSIPHYPHVKEGATQLRPGEPSGG